MPQYSIQDIASLAPEEAVGLATRASPGVRLSFSDWKVAFDDLKPYQIDCIFSLADANQTPIPPEFLERCLCDSRDEVIFSALRMLDLSALTSRLAECAQRAIGVLLDHRRDAAVLMFVEQLLAVIASRSQRGA